MGLLKWLKSKFTSTATPAGATASATDTEFSAEIVRVTSIAAHPNADRLQIAKFEMAGSGESAYEVVIQKNEFRPGQLASYLSVDCVLPLSCPAFTFLGTRLDGAGRAHFRLRAARLRGVFSQGLLVPAPEGFEFGASVARHFGVTYHQEPVKGGPLQPSAKRARREPFAQYSVDSLKKLPRLFESGEQVCITEKIHGTNFRFGWVRRKILGVPLGWRFVVGSHRTIRGDGRPCFYEGGDLYLQAAHRMDLANATKRWRGLAFYGELYGHTYSGEKIQDLTYGTAPQDGPRLAIFDIKNLADNEWEDAWARFDICLEAGLEHVPILNACTGWLPELAADHGEGRVSDLDRKTVREGVVIESLTGPRRKAKYVSQSYLLRKVAP